MSRRGVAATLLALALPGCGDPAGVEPVELGEAFTLAPDEVAWIDEASLLLSFTGVTADSRCPVDVQCVTAGDATVAVTARRPPGERTPLELHTDSAAGGAVVHEGYRIALVSLEPQPRSDRPIPPGDYRATFRIDPL